MRYEYDIEYAIKVPTLNVISSTHLLITTKMKLRNNLFLLIHLSVIKKDLNSHLSNEHGS